MHFPVFKRAFAKMLAIHPKRWYDKSGEKGKHIEEMEEALFMESSATIIFSDSIQNTVVNGQIKPSISNPINFIKPYAIPGNYSFAIFCIVENLPIKNEHKLSVKTYNVNGDCIFESGEIIVNEQMGNIEDMCVPVSLSVEFRNLIIPDVGEIKV